MHNVGCSPVPVLLVEALVSVHGAASVGWCGLDIEVPHDEDASAVPDAGTQPHFKGLLGTEGPVLVCSAAPHSSQIQITLSASITTPIPA